MKKRIFAVFACLKILNFVLVFKWESFQFSWLRINSRVVFELSPIECVVTFVLFTQIELIFHHYNQQTILYIWSKHEVKWSKFGFLVINHSNSDEILRCRLRARIQNKPPARSGVTIRSIKISWSYNRWTRRLRVLKYIVKNFQIVRFQ